MLCTARSCRYVARLTQPLVETQARLRANPNFINVSITEPWLRRYQVLPARTHPDMSTSASGGYILHAVRILSDDDELDENDSSGGPAPPPATDAAPEA